MNILNDPIARVTGCEQSRFGGHFCSGTAGSWRSEWHSFSDYFGMQLSTSGWATGTVSLARVRPPRPTHRSDEDYGFYGYQEVGFGVVNIRNE